MIRALPVRAENAPAARAVVDEVGQARHAVGRLFRAFLPPIAASPR